MDSDAAYSPGGASLVPVTEDAGPEEAGSSESFDSIFDLLPSDDPDLRSLLVGASRHLDGGRRLAALDLCWRAIGGHSQALAPQLLLARIELARDRRGLAEERLLAVADLAERRSDLMVAVSARRELARLGGAGSAAEARYLAALQAATRLEPEDPELILKLAEALFQSGDVDGARGTFARLADLLDRQGDPSRALAMEQAAAALGPGDLDGQLRLAQRYRAMDLVSEAVSVLDQALTGQSGSATDLVVNALRLLIELVGPLDSERALTYRRRLVELNPLDRDARSALALAYLEQNQIAPALEQVLYLAAALGQAGRWTEAAQVLGEARQLAPSDRELIVAQIEALRQGGDVEAATALLVDVWQEQASWREHPTLRRLAEELASRDESR